MSSRDFCYWLQGWFELNATIDHRAGASAETLDVIRNHLSLVFIHEIDPQHAQTVPANIAQPIHDHGKPQIGGADAHGNVYRC